MSYSEWWAAAGPASMKGCVGCPLGLPRSSVIEALSHMLRVLGLHPSIAQVIYTIFSPSPSVGACRPTETFQCLAFHCHCRKETLENALWFAEMGIGQPEFGGKYFPVLWLSVVYIVPLIFIS